MFRIINLSFNKIEEARIGRAEFFAPDALREPSRLLPPLIKSLSICFYRKIPIVYCVIYIFITLQKKIDELFPEYRN